MTTHASTRTSLCRVLLGLAIMWGRIGLPERGRCADDGDFARATLRGLQGVSLLLEDIHPEVVLHREGYCGNLMQKRP
jgi:hypothetical protein